MESGKPSKEQLEQFYKTSRKYFDELARQYYENDREFYNQNFAQYYKYRNTNWRRKPKISVGLVLVIFGLIAGVGFASYFIMKPQTPNYTYNKKASVDEKNAKSVENQKNLNTDKLDSINLSYMKTDFEKGTYFYNLGEYDKAKPYFERVKKDDDDYNFAQDVLKAIERKKSAVKK